MVNTSKIFKRALLPRTNIFICLLPSFLLIHSFASATFAQAVLRSVSGEVWIEKNTVRFSAHTGARVDVGASVVTGATGRAELLLSDASHLSAEHFTRVNIGRSRASTTGISIQRGSARITTSPYRWKTEAFELTSPVTTTGVRGLYFRSMLRRLVTLVFMSRRAQYFPEPLKQKKGRFLK